MLPRTVNNHMHWSLVHVWSEEEGGRGLPCPSKGTGREGESHFLGEELCKQQKAKRGVGDGQGRNSGCTTLQMWFPTSSPLSTSKISLRRR